MKLLFNEWKIGYKLFEKQYSYFGVKEIDLNLEPGIYLLGCITKEGRKCCRFVID